MAERYQYRSTYHGPKVVPPEIVAQELDRLEEAGELRASRVVEEARSVDAPLHKEFNWDDPDAANEYRLVQARCLIRSLVVIREHVDVVKPETIIVIPESRFAHDPGARGRGEGRYLRLDRIANDQGAFARALREAERGLDAAQRRVDELRQLAQGRANGVAALAIASRGFSTVREALALLRAA